MTKLSKEQVMNANIMAALFKVTIEQSTFLINELKYKPKQAFKLWESYGWKMLEEFDKNGITSDESVMQIVNELNNLLYEAKRLSLNNN